MIWGLLLLLLLILPLAIYLRSPEPAKREEKPLQGEQVQDGLAESTSDAPRAESPESGAKKEEHRSHGRSWYLTAAERLEFGRSLYPFLDEPEQVEREKRLIDQIEEFEQREGFSPLWDSESWRLLHEDHFLTTIRWKLSESRGQLREATALLEVKGELFAFEYAYILPGNYDPQKRWPILICLHDEGSDGKTYLQELWQSSPVDKDLCKNFILVAPDLREKTLGRTYPRGQSVEERIEWFDNSFLRSIVQPFNELREQLHTDPERVFMEGVGSGADAAVEFASLFPGRIAGVISRHGGMRDPKALASLEGTKVLFLSRAESEFMQDASPAAKLLSDLKSVQVKNPALEVIVREAPSQKPFNNKPIGGQNTDPLIDMNAEVAKFIAKSKLNPYPDTFHIVCGPRGFKSHPLAKITSHEATEDDYLDFRLTFDREKNRILADGRGFFRFTVFLNDLILDLEKPVEVVINGQELERRKVERNPKLFLSALIAKPFDHHQAFTAQLVVDVPEAIEEEEASPPADGGVEKR